MINTQLTSQIANAQKNDIKLDNTPIKDKSNSKDSPKEALSQALKQNLGLDKDASKEEIITKLIQNETGTKLKELVNKLLEQINSQKNPDSPVLKQSKNLNLAPNFANELKTLATELEKNDIFSQVLDKLNQILKPASEIKSNNFAPLFQNSGVFFEAKLKDALSEESLPKSFYSLLSTIKGLSSEKLSSQIAQIIVSNLDPKDALKELKNIIQTNKKENKQILDQSSFKALLKLSSKIDNFKNYISKNPSIAQNKIMQIANKITKELTSLKGDFFKALNKPENLMIKDTNILKQAAKAFEKLENTLKNILGEHNFKPSQKDNEILKDLLSDKKDNVKNEIPKEMQNQHVQKDKLEQDEKTENASQDFDNDELINKDEETGDVNKELVVDKDEKTENASQDFDNDELINKDEENLKENITQDSKDKKQENIKNNFDKDTNIKNNPRENSKIYEAKNDNIPKNATQNISNQNNSMIQSATQTNIQTQENIFKTQEFIKQNNIKNLAFMVENLDLDELQNLSKDLGNLSRKINESLRELEPHIQHTKLNQAEIKNLERKLDLSAKDLAQIKPKTDQEIAESLHHDIKSTLLQISNLAKNEGNEAVYNQANRLLAQIEINQLISLANDSINTYLPFSWEDLNDSKIMFRRGKKDKFFAQIKLEFAKLGDLEILISLNNEKYIDINIMAENKEFRKTIYENAHELKKNINKAGLLSANFFVGDIIRSKFDSRNIKNLDLEMGMDKKV
ncbi:flagellar hook-length control protein FliK [Campylobacter estrildidarum]|uniref:Flagellar hook-length control protein FliK n=1 Tax=Campylobacter estrildidarum TaxID=2510189 RepID=A0A4U7BL00_9BACT|nr:flagellar hook-length control protein FliK [Campylobacter estrildidarum]TKX30945.1 flagellar hook-length control protein FliK [Campylobacter estrildidarum]